MNESFPKVEDNYFQERQGVYKVASILNNLELIFRETPNADVGIDGMVEFIEGNKATGKIIAVQIKSGSSYFLHETDKYYKFYPKDKHKIYWETFPIPVLLLLHNPTDDKVYYTDARFFLKNKENINSKFISIQKNNILNNKNDLFYTFGLNYDYYNILNQDGLFQKILIQDDIDKINYYMSNEELLNFIINQKHTFGSYELSFFDLFVAGLTNIGTQVFFNISLVHSLIERFDDLDFFGFGQYEHDFLNKYAKFLINQNLAVIDFSSYLIDWEERNLQPQFLATLTSRGMKFTEFIFEKSKSIFGEKSFLISETLILTDIQSNNTKTDQMKEFVIKYNLQ